MGKLLPVLLGLLGLAAGGGAGYLLRPAPGGGPEAAAGGTDAGDLHAAAATGAGTHGAVPGSTESSGHGAKADGAAPEYVRITNQFIVPVVEGGRVVATVVLTLALEVPAGRRESVFAREPRLRDAFLRVLFDHANAGGFRGVFTDGANLVVLRQALLEAARKVMGDEVTDVLISDLVRQDA